MSQESITPEFEDRYKVVDTQCKTLAMAILEHVKLNDVRRLKKIENILKNTISEIKSIT